MKITRTNMLSMQTTIILAPKIQRLLFLRATKITMVMVIKLQGNIMKLQNRKMVELDRLNPKRRKKSRIIRLN